MKKKTKLPTVKKVRALKKKEADLNDILVQLKKLNEKANVCPCYHLNQCPLPHYPPTPPYPQPPYQPTWTGGANLPSSNPPAGSAFIGTKI